MNTRLYGVDFTSAPSRRKNITIAQGRLAGHELQLMALHGLADFPAFDSWLHQPGPWLAAFDFPFSLPRALVEQLDWPRQWPALVTQIASQTRAQLREQFKAVCDSRPAGSKFIHRATDLPAGSSSPMKWVNPPVAFMLHAGAPRLLQAGVHLPHLHAGDPDRIGLEAYPGLVARSFTRKSYKNDGPARRDPARAAQRLHILQCLETSGWRGIRLATGPWRFALLEDGSGDLLDAALCLVVAAWSWQRRDQNFGLPASDPLEGWIAGALPPPD